MCIGQTRLNKILGAFIPGGTTVGKICLLNSGKLPVRMHQAFFNYSLHMPDSSFYFGYSGYFIKLYESESCYVSL